MIYEILNLFLERKDFFLQLMYEHLQLSGIAIIISCSIGLMLGVLISEYKGLAPFVTGMTNFIYTIPSISLLGFLIPISGIGNKSAIIALTVYGLLPMIGNTFAGIQNVDAELIESAKGMGSTRLQILYKIKLPLAFPVILSGIRTMVVMTVSLTGIASFIGAGGLGVAIYRGITTNSMAMTLAGSTLIAAIAIVLDRIFYLVEKNIAWKKELPS